MKEYALGFDIGGTRMKCGAVTRDGKVLHHATVPTEAHRGPEHLVRAMTRYVSTIKRDFGPASAIGLGLCGTVDPKIGVVHIPGKFAGLEDFPIVRQIAEKTGIPTIAENDARSALIAEQEFGLARKQKWVVLLTIGTGLGSGVILDGQILRDPHLMFGTQLGHLVIDADNRHKCLTGPCGTAEMLCSASALANGVRDGLQRGITSILTDQYWRNPHSVDFKAVIDAAKKKDRLCVDELNIWRTHLGWAVVNAVHAYAPELIILGGGGSQAAPAFLGALKKQVAVHIYRFPRNRPPRIVTSKLGDQAGLLGAAAVAWKAL